MRRHAAPILLLLSVLTLGASPANETQLAGIPVGFSALEGENELSRPVAGESDAVSAAGRDEMLSSSEGQFKPWTRVPELTVLTSVMAYHSGQPTSYVATSEQLTEQEVDELAADLTAALVLMTGNAYGQFAAIHREAVAPGTTLSILHRGGIVAGRFRSVQALTHTIGLGGRGRTADGTITSAAIILDSDFDRTSPKRRLLRTHELGHALGYGHVSSRRSIMNPTIGPEPTELDRRIAALAFAPRLALLQTQ